MAAPEGAAWVPELPMPPPLFSSMLCETLGQAAGVSGPRVPGAAQALYDAVVKCDALGPLALGPLALPLNKHSWNDREVTV
jgi:hypothetical protein